MDDKALKPIEYGTAQNAAGDTITLTRHHHREPAYCVSVLQKGRRRPHEYWLKEYRDAADLVDLLVEKVTRAQ